MKHSMITILGPTASGKTSLAAALASHINGMDSSMWGGDTHGAEIISADSRQVYRGMDIGTGKDLEDYTVGGKLIPYHLIDICDAGTKYNLFQYQQDFYDVYQDITHRGVLPILCGGTGLYIESVLKGYHLSPVPQNPALRTSLEGKTLEELKAKIIAQGYAEVEAERKRVQEELRVKVASLAVAGAEKIVGRSIDEAANNDIIDKLVAEL